MLQHCYLQMGMKTQFRAALGVNKTAWFLFSYLSLLASPDPPTPCPFVNSEVDLEIAFVPQLDVARPCACCL